ncbi:MAG: TetR/AcrR family transcriptional regulator [Lachnospiraceae bacterium]
MGEIGYFKNLTRKDYVEKAHDIIVNEGIEAISIRRIAKEMNCSSTSLYHYFSNLEELLVFAQLGFLTDYIENLQRHEKIWENVWDVYIGIWECFALQAFTTPAAFNTIFFGTQSKELPSLLMEYFEMYPEAIHTVSHHLQMMLQEGNFAKRDYYMAVKCAEEGVISMENAKKMNRLCVYCFKGMLKEVLDEGETDVPKKVAELVDCVTDIALFYGEDTTGIKQKS